MSDLVSGLQNRIERFDSATGLSEKSLFEGVTFSNYELKITNYELKITN